MELKVWKHQRPKVHFYASAGKTTISVKQIHANDVVTQAGKDAKTPTYFELQQVNRFWFIICPF